MAMRACNACFSSPRFSLPQCAYPSRISSHRCFISWSRICCSSHFYVASSELPHRLGEAEQHKERCAAAASRLKQELGNAVLIWRAIKLPIYSVALVPLSVGAAVAFWQSRVFHSGRYLLLLLSGVLIITWLNLSNDAYDSQTGVDKNKKESVVNLTGSYEGVLYAAYTCLLFGMTGIVMGGFQANRIKVVALLAAAIACGYAYQGPPFRLGYKGLGEPLCFLAFGPLATTAFYFSQASRRGIYHLPVTGTILAASILVGMTTSLILFCSHFHQIEEDKLVGKISPLVRLGTQQGADIVKGAVIGIYSLLAAFSAVKILPIPCSLFSLLTLPVGGLLIEFVNKNHANKEKIFLAKYYSVRLHVAFGAALVLGFLTASHMPS